MSRLVNQQKVTVKKRLMVRVIKSGSAFLVTCDTVMCGTVWFVKESYRYFYISGAVHLKPVQKLFPTCTSGRRETTKGGCNAFQ